MKTLRAMIPFTVIMLIFGMITSHRYHQLNSDHLKMREANLQSAYTSIINTFRLVSKNITDEVVKKEPLLKLVHEIVNSQGAQRNLLRGQLYRQLYQTYARASQHSIRQFHFHFPNGHSMLRFHAPEQADDPLFPYRASVNQANKNLREVHGYESGRIVHGFRHVFPLSYQNTHIGSVEVSTSFQQVNNELKKLNHTDDTELLFLMYKPDLWHKLATGQQQLYLPSLLNTNYLIENDHAPEFQALGGTAKTPEYLSEIQQQIKNTPEVINGMKTGENFAITTNYDHQIYSVIFHSIYNTENEHAAYLISITVEPYIQALRTNAIIQFSIAALFTIIVLLYRNRLALAREKQHKTADFLATLSNNMGECLYATDTQGNITFINSEASKALGYPRQEMMGQSAHHLFHVDDNSHEHGCFILNAILQGVTCKHEQAYFKDKHAKKFAVELTCTPIHDKGNVIGTITLFHDISLRLRQQQELLDAKQQLEEANTHLNELARIDALTGVANRREFDQTLTSLWKSNFRKNAPLSILMIDIDHFKAYNDSYGHQQGDKCLRQVVQKINAACLRPDDFVARYGGEEFVVLLPETDQNDAIHVADRILTYIHDSKIDHNSSPVNSMITLSIGLCTLIPHDLTSTQELIDCADRRLYLAKNNGRNQLCYQDQP